MAKKKTPKVTLAEAATTSHKIHLELTATVIDVEYCRLEKIKFEPHSNSFQFKDGKWIADHKNFPIEADNTLDLMIVVIGNTGTTCKLLVQIDGKPANSYDPYEPFGKSGRTFFQLSIPV